MKTVRFNPFHKIHQALRALLYHAGITVQHTDFTQPEQTHKTLLLLRELVSFFESHAHTEDTLVFPMISGIAPGLVADFEEQHVTDHQLGEDLCKAMDACLSPMADEQKIRAGHQLQIALTAFTAFNLVHMNKEETDVLPVILANYSDEELHAKEREIVAQLSPEKKALSGYWMLRGLAIPEIIEWYKQIRATAPSFVFDEFMQLAEKALNPEKLKTIHKELQLSLV